MEEEGAFRFLGNIQCRVDHEDPIIIYFNALLEPKIHCHINFMLLSLIEEIFIFFDPKSPRLYSKSINSQLTFKLLKEMSNV